LGTFAGAQLTTGGNNIDIGNLGVGGEADTIRIGASQTATFIAGISGAPVSGTAVVVNAGGQLGVTPSSQRFKEHIAPIDEASETLLRLKPVAFRYKKEIDPAGTPQFGLLAEDVEKVNPDLVVRDKQGTVYSVRYDQVNALLLNEFLKEHKKVEEQQTIIAGLRSNAAKQQAAISQLTNDVQFLLHHVKEQARANGESQRLIDR
jgi:trimeric autotransporter adhesin